MSAKLCSKPCLINATYSVLFDLWLLVSFPVIIAVVILIMFGLLVILGRYYFRHKGEYRTREAKDARQYDNPDFAVAAPSTRQPEVPKKKEWYL